MNPNHQHSDFAVFVRLFFVNSWMVRQVLLGLLTLIVLLGVLISRVEEMPIGEGIYFAFITALTIGYGDINAVTVPGRIMCVVTGIFGMLFTGITVAIATRSVHDTAEAQRTAKG